MNMTIAMMIAVTCWWVLIAISAVCTIAILWWILTDKDCGFERPNELCETTQYIVEGPLLSGESEKTN